MYNEELIKRNQKNPEIYFAPPKRVVKPKYTLGIVNVASWIWKNQVPSTSNDLLKVYRVYSGQNADDPNPYSSEYTYYIATRIGSDTSHHDSYYKKVAYNDVTSTVLGWDGVKYVLSQYESLIWTERAREPGDFEIKIKDWNREGIPFSLYTENNPTCISCGWFCWIPFDISETIMIVEKISASADDDGSQTITITGRDLTSILERRVIGNGYTEGRYFSDSLWGEEIDVNGLCPSNTFVKSYHNVTNDSVMMNSPTSKIKKTGENSKYIAGASPMYVSPQHAVWSAFCLAFKPSWYTENNNWKFYGNDGDYSSAQNIVSGNKRRFIDDGPGIETTGKMFGSVYNTNGTYASNNPDILFDPVARYASGRYKPNGTPEEKRAIFNGDNNWYVFGATQNKYFLDSGLGGDIRYGKSMLLGNVHWSASSRNVGSSYNEERACEIPNLYLSAAGFSQKYVYYKNEYSWANKSGVRYEAGNIVFYEDEDKNGYHYECISAYTTGSSPTTPDKDASHWKVYTGDLKGLDPVVKTLQFNNTSPNSESWDPNKGLDRYSYAADGYGLRANYWEMTDIQGQTFLSWLQEMANTYYFSFKIYPHPKIVADKTLNQGCDVFFLECIPTCDRSYDYLKSYITDPKYANNKINPVCFSIENGTLNTASWNYDTSKYVNTYDILGQTRIDKMSASVTDDNGNVSTTDAEMDYGLVYGWQNEYTNPSAPNIRNVKRLIPRKYINDDGKVISDSGNIKYRNEEKQLPFKASCSNATDGSWNNRKNNEYSYMDRRTKQMSSSAQRDQFPKGSFGDTMYKEYMIYEARSEMMDDENGYVYAVEADINKDNPVFGYKTSYNLGDYVSVHTPFLMQKKAMVTEYIYSWDKDGYSEYPTFTYIDNSESITT